MTKDNKSLIPADRIEKSILMIRGEKVMLDYDLAVLYKVPTRRLNEQVKRNSERFPSDFMFQLTKQQLENWRSHFATRGRTSAFFGFVGGNFPENDAWDCFFEVLIFTSIRHFKQTDFPENG